MEPTAAARMMSDPRAALGQSPFPPVADYAFLSDCEVTALIAPSGNVEWLCLPQFDSPSVFSSILDRDAGRFRLGPADVEVPAGRRYLLGSMVTETTWMTKTGWLMVRDALTIGKWHHKDERAYRQRRAPTDHEAEHILLRTAKCVHGTVDLILECEPVFDYGRVPPEWEYTDEGYRHAVARGGGVDLNLRLDSSMRIGFEGRRANARTTLTEGERAYVALGWSEHAGPGTVEEAFARIDQTSDYWREWLSRGIVPDHQWRVPLQRSAMMLKGLSYAPSGAIAAAATTSLPRVPGGTRNYDSRYSFLRDSALALRALYSLGFDWEADDFFFFLADLVERGKPMRNLYPVAGEATVEEEELDHFTGYEHARPVRIGNAAASYEQHDVWGAVLDAAYLYAGTRDRLPARLWPIVESQVEAAVSNWRKPDMGIWASRREPQHYVSSKVMCWVACDRGSKLAARRDRDRHAERWREVANEIKQDVLEGGVDSRGVFTAWYGTEELDASVLLIPIVGFLPPSDERVVATVEAIASELVEGGLVLRRRPPDSSRGVVPPGETYIVCSFWLAHALALIGETGRARALCEKMLALSSPLQLYAEHLDPDTGRHLGNYPAAMTHLALINALMQVIEAEDPNA